MELNNKAILKLVVGGTIATAGAILSGVYELNTLTLFVIALGLAVFTVGLRERLLGIMVTVMGLNLVFIGLTYDPIDTTIRTVSVLSIGIVTSVIGGVIQGKIFIDVIDSDEEIEE